jgi:uncharacterized protein (DUF1501 family)
MESGAPGNKAVADGWLSRALMACPEDRAKLATPLRAVAMAGAMPRSLQGDVGALAIPDLRSFGVGANLAGGRMGRQSNSATSASDGFETLYDDAVGDVLHGTGKESFEAIHMLARLKPASYVPENSAVYPAGRFGESLKQIAQLIKADVGVEVAFAEMGGWDTHANQGGAQGQLATRLREFSQAIAALYTDLGDRMADVTILTMSEFGRTARQNGTGGTDHGHATCFFALGGNVNGGKVLGQWPGLAPEQLNEGRDLALTTDFRVVFAEMADKQLGTARLEKVFPGFAVSPQSYRNVLRT